MNSASQPSRRYQLGSDRLVPSARASPLRWPASPEPALWGGWPERRRVGDEWRKRIHARGYGTGETIADAREAANDLAGKIVIPNARCRSDIGHRLIQSDFVGLQQWGLQLRTRSRDERHF
jgi:hypothetical protein